MQICAPHCRRFPLTVGLAALMALSGCLGGSTEPVPVSGVYELQSVNGKPLPFVFPNGVTINKETFTIFLDGTFSDVTTQGDGTVVSDLGNYTNFGGTINFIDVTIGFAYQGIVSGNNLSIVVGSYSSAFAKTGGALH